MIDKVISKVINALVRIQQLKISDNEKAEHLKGIIAFTNIRIDKQSE